MLVFVSQMAEMRMIEKGRDVHGAHRADVEAEETAAYHGNGGDAIYVAYLVAHGVFTLPKASSDVQNVSVFRGREVGMC